LNRTAATVRGARHGRTRVIRWLRPLAGNRGAANPKEIKMSKMSVSDLKSMLASEKANALAAISAARLMEG